MICRTVATQKIARLPRKITKTTQKTPRPPRKTTQKIISAIEKNPSITRERLSEICGISSDGIKWQLKQLQAKNIIRRVGADKGGHWEIIKEEK